MTTQQVSHTTSVTTCLYKTCNWNCHSQYPRILRNAWHSCQVISWLCGTCILVLYQLMYQLYQSLSWCQTVPRRTWGARVRWCQSEVPEWGATCLTLSHTVPCEVPDCPTWDLVLRLQLASADCHVCMLSEACDHTDTSLPHSCGAWAENEDGEGERVCEYVSCLQEV